MEDTIVAISTLVGNSAINIIRLSGKDSIKIVSKFFVGKNLNKVSGNTINYGKFKYKNEIIDEVLISVFKEDKSYTKENMIEINSHGGIICVNKILEILLEENVRMAEPGEFIKRAFLNGRIDLVEAESVSDLIVANSENARKLSLNGVNGEVSQMVKELREDILDIVGNIEVNIDYPEYEDIEELTIDKLNKKLLILIPKFKDIYEKSKKTEKLKTGISVAIVGKPNVGKSSILNKMIGENKAIVTNIEGTTRDIVEGSIILNGTNINFIDTAGIRETKNIIESLGIEKSKEIVKSSDLVLFVLNYNDEFTKEDENILKEIENKKKIIVINKSDLSQKINVEFKDPIVYVNTIEENGTSNLENKIKEMFDLGEIQSDDFTYLTNERQINILKESINILEDIKKSIDLNTPIDLIQIDLTKLWNKLGEILGETYEEELLDNIFSKFCLGK